MMVQASIDHLREANGVEREREISGVVQIECLQPWLSWYSGVCTIRRKLGLLKLTQPGKT
jgi:hypothetical protein